MRQYLVEYGADGWREWTTVSSTDPNIAEAKVMLMTGAEWAVVVDDVTGLTDDETADTVEGHAKGLY